MTAPCADRATDLLVSIPRPRWRTIRRTLLFGCGAVFYFLAGLLPLTDLLTNHSATVGRQLLMSGLLALFWLNALIKVVILRFSLNLPLEIFRSGIASQGVKMSWELIQGCRWARYAPGTLEVRTQRTRLYFPIPRDQRTSTEAALRDLGKWQS
jgi:hypothetical protein